MTSTLRVISVWPFSHEGTELSALFDHLTALPAPEHYAGFEAPAPILVLPHVFEPDLCRRLITAYKGGAKAHTGIMQEHGAMTVGVQDRSFKVRQDHISQSQPLKQAVQPAIYRRTAPAVARYFQFQATRIERYIVASYASEDGGHFSLHRDNTTKGAAHIGRLTFASDPAYVLIVENVTSFIRHVREVNQDLAGAVVFSGGFPSRPTLNGITRLISLTQASTYHWGDNRSRRPENLSSPRTGVGRGWTQAVAAPYDHRSAQAPRRSRGAGVGSPPRSPRCRHLRSPAPTSGTGTPA